MKAAGPVHLGAVRIESCSVPAAVTVASLSKEQAIPEAKRMLLVFSTDALNNGVRFKDERRRVLEKLGTLPVLWRTGKLSLSIRNAAAGSPKLYALALNGERREELPVRVDVPKSGTAAGGCDFSRPFFCPVPGKGGCLCAAGGVC